MRAASSCSSIDIMALLKADTAEQHRHVEQLMPFFRKDFSITAYRHTLEAFFGFHAGVERRLAAITNWDQAGIRPADLARSHLLRDDLLALGLSDPMISDLPRFEGLRQFRGLAHGLGCLYVLEGSLLGGQFIARELARRFGIDHASGSSFFSGGGCQVGARWAKFCQHLRDYCDSDAKASLVSASARDTFSAFETWMLEAGFHEC